MDELGLFLTQILARLCNIWFSVPSYSVVASYPCKTPGTWHFFYDGVLVYLFLHEDIGYEKLPKNQRFKAKALLLKVSSTVLKLLFLYEWGYW